MLKQEIVIEESKSTTAYLEKQLNEQIDPVQAALNKKKNELFQGATRKEVSDADKIINDLTEKFHKMMQLQLDTYRETSDQMEQGTEKVLGAVEGVGTGMDERFKNQKKLLHDEFSKLNKQLKSGCHQNVVECIKLFLKFMLKLLYFMWVYVRWINQNFYEFHIILSRIPLVGGTASLLYILLYYFFYLVVVSTIIRFVGIKTGRDNLEYDVFYNAFRGTIQGIKMTTQVVQETVKEKAKNLDPALKASKAIYDALDHEFGIGNKFEGIATGFQKIFEKTLVYFQSQDVETIPGALEKATEAIEKAAQIIQYPVSMVRPDFSKVLESFLPSREFFQRVAERPMGKNPFAKGGAAVKKGVSSPSLEDEFNMLDKLVNDLFAGVKLPTSSKANEAAQRLVLDMQMTMDVVGSTLEIISFMDIRENPITRKTYKTKVPSIKRPSKLAVRGGKKTKTRK